MCLLEFQNLHSNSILNKGTVQGHYDSSSEPVYITSNIPVLLSQDKGGCNDAIQNYPLGREWYGIPSRGFYIGTGPQAANVKLYFSNSSLDNESVFINPYSVYYWNGDSETPIDTSHGQNLAAYIISDAPIHVQSYADYDGCEAASFLPPKELDKLFFFPSDMEYASISTPYPSTVCTAYNESGAELEQRTSGNNSYPNPNFIQFGNGNGYWTSAGAKISCNNLAYIMWEIDAYDQETESFGAKGNRQYIYPEPSYEIGITYNTTNPFLNFVNPTPGNGTSQKENYALVNITIGGSYLNTFKLSWNNSDITFSPQELMAFLNYDENSSVNITYNYSKREITSLMSNDESLVLSMSFENRSILGENSTSFYDYSKYKNHGTCDESANECPTYMKGKYGKGLKFDGLNDFVNVSDDASLDITDAITIEVWFNHQASWNQNRTIQYVVSDFVIGSDMDIVSYMDNNQISNGTHSITLNKGEIGTLGIGSNITKIEGSQPFSIGFNKGGVGDTTTPLSFAGKKFVLDADRGSETFDFIAPFEDSQCNIYNQTNLLSTLNILKDGHSEYVGNIGGDWTLIECNASVLVHHEDEDQNYDLMPLYPAGKDWWGIVTCDGGYLACAEDSTSLEVYTSDGTLSSYNCNRGDTIYLGISAPSQGPGVGVHVIATKSVGVYDLADCDGTESWIWLPHQELNQIFWLPQGAQYVSIATSQPHTTCVLYNGTHKIEKTSEGLNEPYPNAIFFGSTSSGEHIPAGSSIVCDAPVFAYYEYAAQNGETNLWGVGGSNLIRKGDAYGLLSEGDSVIGFINTALIHASLESGWHYLTLSYNGSSQKLYVDGELKAEHAVSEVITTNDNPLVIGGSFFNGTIDEVRIYNRALSEEEVMMHYLLELKKFDPNKWNFLFNITDLDEGSYEYYAYANDSAGNYNTTDEGNMRYLTIDNTNPKIRFEYPTPENNIYINKSSTLINVSVSDTLSDTISTFIDFNRSLVGYWSFDLMNSTHVFDNSTYGNNGTFQGGLSDVNQVHGKFGKALSFDGVDDYVAIDKNIGNVNAFTTEAWIYLKSYPQLSTDQSQIIRDPYVAVDNATHKVKVYNYGVNDVNGDGYYYGNSTIGLNQWYHIATTFDNSTGEYRIYINGILDAVTLGKYGAPQINFDNIGGEPTCCGGRYFNGTIDEVRIWNRALSPEEINASYHAGLNKLYRNFTNLPDGTYEYYAYAIDEAGNVNQTEVRNVTIDTITPIITFTKPSQDNLTLVAKWFNQNITVSDLNLYWLNCTIYNSTGGVYWSEGWNLTGNTTYTVTNIVDISNWPIGSYYENCIVWDLTER
jgi:hypothetical protein